MRKIIIIFLLVVVCRTNLFSGNNYFFSPGVSCGYTFGAGMNWGFMFDVGAIKYIPNNYLKYGLSFSWYYVSVQSSKTMHYTHRLRSLGCLMIQNNFADLKLGFGRVKNPWGTKNRCIIHGPTADISFSYPSIYCPWIGFKTLRYANEDWAWFSKPYNSVYIKYKFDVIQNTEAKNMSVFK